MKKNENTYVAIMAGGIGSRFWPSSRTATPKQFLDILGVGKSLIQLTVDRFLNLCPKENIFIVTNGMYKDLVKVHLPFLKDNQILCEPSRNNTAPCVAYTALKLHEINPKANFIIAPSDHIILQEKKFLDTVEYGLEFTQKNNALLTLGINPTRPDTGYGYIKFGDEKIKGIHKVDAFTEKPDMEKAKAFLATGQYVWNAGIFIWNTESILAAFKKYATEIYDILGQDKSVYNTDSEQDYIDQHYPTTPKISIDYAIMEKADNVYTLPTEFGWSDLGTWASLHAEDQKDDQLNTSNTDLLIFDNVKDCLIRTQKDKLVVIKDLDDYIIVDEKDVLLIYPKSKEQEIKALRNKIVDRFEDRFS